MKKPKILLLFTGGTIAQIKDPVLNTLVPAKTPEDILKLVPEIRDHFDIDYHFIVNLDSSNIQPKHWIELAQTIYGVYAKYDGFVVTHGTDTMSYTASALSFALQNLGKPVVLTGSQLPPDALGTDAKNNLINAFRVAAEDIAEVVIVFGDKILRGNRSSKRSESSFDAFWSPVFSDLGRVRLDVELFNHHKKRNNTLKPKLSTDFSEEVFVFTLTPGVKPAYFDMLLGHGIKGFVVEGFGAGNVPSYENSIIPSIKKAVDKQIPVLINSQCAAGVAKVFLYQTGKVAAETGAISAEDMTLEASITKLMWVLGQTKDIKKVRKLIKDNIAGEISE